MWVHSLRTLLAAAAVIGTGTELAIGQVPEHPAAGADADDAELASALDNYRLRWSQRLTPVDESEPGSTDAGEPSGGPATRRAGDAWERRIGAGVDGVDSLGVRGGLHGSRAELSTRVQGPATLRFAWQADVGSGDSLEFLARDAAGSVARREVIERTGGWDTPSNGWEWKEFRLPNREEYVVVWAYVKDGFDEPGIGSDVASLDAVTIAGPRYAEIPVDVLQDPASGSVQLTWPTLQGRFYQLLWRDDARWVRAAEPIQAAALRASHSVFRQLHEGREYCVELIEPPSFVTLPRGGALRAAEGENVTLEYDVEGSAAFEPFTWIWSFTPADGGEPRILENRSGVLSLSPAARAHEGDYRVTVRNGAGGETAPVVAVKVFEAPAVHEIRWTAGGERWVASGNARQTLRLRRGERFEIEAGVGGSPPLAARWERLRKGGERWETLTQSVIEPGETVIGYGGEGLSRAGEGDYRLVVANEEWGEAASPILSVRLDAPPELRRIPDGERVDLLESDVVWLEADVEDERGVCYEWFRDGLPVVEASRPGSGTNPAGEAGVPRREAGSRVRIETGIDSAPGGGPESIEARYVLQVRARDPADGSCGQPPAQSHRIGVRVSARSAREIPDLGMRLLPVPAGGFRMGGAMNPARAGGNEHAVLDVLLTHAFWLQDTEVTRAQWDRVMEPSVTPAEGGSPRSAVTHDEAMRFVATLNERERAAGRLPDGYSYALPTEAQWERAARVAVGDEYVPGEGVESQRIVDVRDAHPAGDFRGLLGNLWEWTASWYGPQDPNDAVNPSGPETGEERALRGGGMDIRPDASMPTTRLGARPDERHLAYGFRVALVRRGEAPVLVIGRIEGQQAGGQQ